MQAFSIKILDKEEFRAILAEWMLKNSRCVPSEKSAYAQDFLDAYRLPEFDWSLSQSYVGADGKIYLHFKSYLRLLSCQSKDGKAPRSLTVWQMRSRELGENGNETLIGFGVG